MRRKIQPGGYFKAIAARIARIFAPARFRKICREEKGEPTSRRRRWRRGRSLSRRPSTDARTLDREHESRAPRCPRDAPLALQPTASPGSLRPNSPHLKAVSAAIWKAGAGWLGLTNCHC